ncbi:hypothetical protein E8E95_05540 [Pseudomonas sp. BN414]|uniref:hypothetical protein n=1 Tax=Pseudomonas sp. BN414 TaxID=2567888 RepID=UPI0024585636|nr:hypothetical protein [Pseudomonas sp. BN414]MDH4566135.1 hypothetical protein [Pseudomonas sp. BN414]
MMTEEQLRKERAGFDAAWPEISKHGDAHGWEGVGWAAWQARAQAPIEVTFRAETSVLQAALQAYMAPAGYRASRHHAMVDFHQHQERKWCVLEEDHEKVEKENARLRAELDELAEAAREKEKDYFQLQSEVQNLRAALAEQPARQVGGDERAAYVAWLAGTFPAVFSEADAIHHWQHDHASALAWKARAALAPAAVVMPEPVGYIWRGGDLLKDDDSFKRTLPTLGHKRDWYPVCRMSDITHLNRNAIPVELLRRIASDDEGMASLADFEELRALLGKDGEEVGNG